MNSIFENEITWIPQSADKKLQVVIELFCCTPNCKLSANCVLLSFIIFKCGVGCDLFYVVTIWLAKMGSFLGHILPGTFFILFGVWWSFAVNIRYFKFLVKKIKLKNYVKFRCTPTFQSNCCPHLPIEGLFKVIKDIWKLVKLINHLVSDLCVCLWNGRWSNNWIWRWKICCNEY